MLDDLESLGYLSGKKIIYNHYLEPHYSIIFLSLLEYFTEQGNGLFSADFNELRNIGFTSFWKLTDDIQYSIFSELKKMGAIKIEQTGNLNQISLRLKSVNDYLAWLEEVA